MTHLNVNTSDGVLWFWMFVVGIGIGPSMSGFTVVIQSTAPPGQMGVATSTLTFLRQIGGSVGLAIAGTLFTQEFTQKLPGRLLANGVPAQLVKRFSSGNSSSSGGNLTGVNLTAQLNHTLPPSLHGVVPHIVAGINEAFALAVSQVFWLTVGASVLAFVAVAFLPNLQLRERADTAVQVMEAVPGVEVGQEKSARAGEVAV